MIATVSQSKVKGTVTAPASKSAMQRACALALLHEGVTIIQNPGKSNDDIAAIDIIKNLGAKTKYFSDKSLQVKSSGKIVANKSINCGESGLSLRMFAPIVSMSNKEIIINGLGSLLKRPVHFFDEVLPQLNVATQTTNGFLPIKIKGPLVAKNITVDGSSSSQFLTGLLFVFAKLAKQRLTITVNDLKSKPYINLSLHMLQHFGYQIEHENFTKFHISPSKKKIEGIIYYTEGDWSGAAFLLVAGAIGGSIKVKGLNINSPQADIAVLEVLKNCGANIIINETEIEINNEHSLKPFSFDATDCPDLFPPLVALAAYCNGASVITGISRLASKESNRAETLSDVFGKMGVTIKLKNDDMIIEGGGIINGAEVSSHHDHRIAMTCAVAALGAKGKVIIDHAEAVNKSYPDFFEHLKALGASVSL